MVTLELPKSMAALEDEIPRAAILQIILHYGGTELYIPLPENLLLTSKLVEVIGLENALKLSWAKGSYRIDVPKWEAARTLARHKAVLKDASALTPKQLAAKHDLHIRTIYQILRNPPNAEVDSCFLEGLGIAG